jgi:glutathionylspermidine synthase
VRRFAVAPRPDWRRRVEALGLVWHTASGVPYWDESAAYAFSLEEIEVLEQATVDLYALYLAAGDHVVRHRLFARFGIPEFCWDLIAGSWRQQPPALDYGRFDLGYDGSGPPKLFEFNCDTPTALLEAAVVQWAWKEDVFPEADQYNSLHDKLVAKWRDIAPRLKTDLVHFTHSRDTLGEDTVTTAYLMDTAIEAGLRSERLLPLDIGWDGRRFVDLHRREIRTLYHLYPWEWLVNEPFGRHLPIARRTDWIEPIWKMIWSNKAMLPILWDLFPRHPNLLWASAERPAGRDFVRKPILGREGGNVRIVRGSLEVAAKDGPHADAPVIYQGLYELPEFDGRYPVLGAWIVDGQPAGLGIREDGLITGNQACFAPHIITTERNRRPE